MNTELSPEQIAEAQNNERDMKAFNDGLTALIQKTGITIVAEVAYTKEGIRPTLRLARMTPRAEEAPVKAKPAKKNGKGKN